MNGPEEIKSSRCSLADTILEWQKMQMVRNKHKESTKNNIHSKVLKINQDKFKEDKNAGSCLTFTEDPLKFTYENKEWKRREVASRMKSPDKFVNTEYVKNKEKLQSSNGGALVIVEMDAARAKMKKEFSNGYLGK
eukprot:CAMPEP_0170543078 /NCGR_PEP_ID=MMETSP0211-20121228/2311_1 /TAXON_ID=311385 /ORGANISM="Pseudokeronopsis sp., Strain OXSARD2" /LENGTH=135 /DNA_ID=CAMNT_0010846359 /DNA_START=1355 /DNA_END=1762 /DNA_ORIENTATION=-